MTQKGKTLVCDIGNGSIKIGYAGVLQPEHVIPCIIASRKKESSSSSDNSNIMNNHVLCNRNNGSSNEYNEYNDDRNHHGDSTSNHDDETVLIGNDALKARDKQKLNFRYPLDNSGSIVDIHCLECLLKFSFQQLGLENRQNDNDYDYKQHKVLVTKPYGMKKEDLKLIFDLFINKFNFKAVTLHEQAALVLYAQGRETGLVVELGDSCTRIVPVYKGHALPQLNKRLAIGGRRLSELMLSLLSRKGYHLDGKQDLEPIREIMERKCYVAIDVDTERHLASETTVLVDSATLWDGTKLSMDRERFETPEALFQPELLDVEGSGLSDLIFDTIQEADIDCRADLYNNIVLSGGVANLPGIKDRLEDDIQFLYDTRILRGQGKTSTACTIHVDDECTKSSNGYLVYEGAAIFADVVSTERKYWVTKKEYTTTASSSSGGGGGGGIDTILSKCRVS